MFRRVLHYPGGPCRRSRRWRCRGRSCAILLLKSRSQVVSTVFESHEALNILVEEDSALGQHISIASEEPLTTALIQEQRITLDGFLKGLCHQFYFCLK
jgi:hypothetical protein